MADERLCITCPVLAPSRDRPRHYERAQCCEGCRERLASLLAELPDLVADLPAAFPKQPHPQTNGSRIRSTPQSSEPISWRPYDLYLPADERKVALRAQAFLGSADPEVVEDLRCQDGVLSVATELLGMVRDWLTYHPDESLPRPTVVGMCGWLSSRLEWACDAHPAIDEFAADLLSLSRSTRSAALVIGRPGEYVGRCPRLLRDEVTRCGAALRVDPYATHVMCNRCGTSWDRNRDEWVTLKADQEAAGLARWQKGAA